MLVEVCIDLRVHEGIMPRCHCMVTEYQCINSCITTPPTITVFTYVSNQVVSCSHIYKYNDLLEVVTGMELRGRASSFCILRYVYLCVDKLELDLVPFLHSFLLTKLKECL